MKAAIRKLGNSKGVIIPKPLLAQAGLEGHAEMTVEHGALVLRRPRCKCREGWSEASRTIAGSGDDALAWPAFANAEDNKLVW